MRSVDRYAVDSDPIARRPPPHVTSRRPPSARRSHAQTVRHVPPRGLRRPDDPHDLPSAHAVIPSHGIVQLYPRQLGVFHLVPRQQGPLLRVRQQHVLGHQHVLGDVHEELHLLELLDVEALRRALEQGLLREGRERRLHDDDRAKHALVLHALRVLLDRLHAHFLLLREEHKDVLGRIVPSREHQRQRFALRVVPVRLPEGIFVAL
mmetsp:Transcript_11315/g.40847  ORF Transcript_11315/g.40847 Transcript_11315/m.40847 type:complete len:207 (-) Transcript_11315:145-765(-)